MTDPDHNGEVKCPHGMVTTLNHHTGRSCIRPIGMNEINHKRSIVNATAQRSRPTKGLFQAANLKSISRKLSVKYMSKYDTADENENENKNENENENQNKAAMKVQATSDKSIQNELIATQQILTSIPFWAISLYHVSKAREEGTLNYHDYCNCRRRGRCECCCDWFNAFFVFDLIIVISAIVLENLSEILSSIHTSMDTATVTEAALFIVFVRLWRVLRVIHGVHEAREKVQAEAEDVSSELKVVLDVSLYSMVVMAERVHAGDLTEKEFFNAFQRIFGNPKHPESKSAARGIGHNYISKIEDHRRENQQRLTKHISRATGLAMDDIVVSGV